jgi:hypothetical protein
MFLFYMHAQISSAYARLNLHSYSSQVNQMSCVCERALEFVCMCIPYTVELGYNVMKGTE